MAEGRYLGARLAEEGEEDGHLRHKGNAGNEQGAEGVDNPLGHHRTQRLGEGNSVVARQQPAARHLAYAGQNQTGGIGDEDGVYTVGMPGQRRAQRLEREPPPPAAQHMAQHPEEERERHPPPVDASAQHTQGLLEVEVPIDPIEHKAPQKQRQHHTQRPLSPFLWPDIAISPCLLLHSSVKRVTFVSCKSKQ